MKCDSDSEESVKCEYKLKIHSFEECIVQAHKTFFLVRIIQIQTFTVLILARDPLNYNSFLKDKATFQ